MRFTLVVAICIVMNAAGAQTPQADSLLKVIQTTTGDSVRADARLKYIQELRHNYSYVSSHVFDGLKESKALHNYVFLGHFHNAAGIMYSQIGNNDSALVHFEKALHYRVYIKDTAGISSSNLGLSNIYRTIGDFRNAIKYGLDAERALLQVNDPGGLARIYNALGLVFKQQADYQKALEYYNKGITQAVLIKDEKCCQAFTQTLALFTRKQKIMTAPWFTIKRHLTCG